MLEEAGDEPMLDAKARQARPAKQTRPELNAVAGGIVLFPRARPSRHARPKEYIVPSIADPAGEALVLLMCLHSLVGGGVGRLRESRAKLCFGGALSDKMVDDV